MSTFNWDLLRMVREERFQREATLVLENFRLRQLLNERLVREQFTSGEPQPNGQTDGAPK